MFLRRIGRRVSAQKIRTGQLILANWVDKVECRVGRAVS
jgi:hypothetical protein